jgi:mono/diheme cytochrome c family protein
MKASSSTACVFAAVLLGCASKAAPAEPAATSPSEGAEATAASPATFDEQVAFGSQEYGEHCAGCHGASGEGSKGAPPVVGIAQGALPLAARPGSQRTAQFTTVADIATFVVAAMPPKAPGSLTADEYWSILAFDLSANGIKLDQKLTPELAQTLTIPR